MKRSPLANRGQLFYYDVAQAIEELAERKDVVLPKAFDLPDILEQLVNIAERDENDVRHKLPPGIRAAVHDRFKNKLTNSSVLQAGYRHYETQSGNSAVPVTRFFFTSFYDPDNPRCIDDMSDFDVQQSLPSRPRLIKTTNGGGEDDTVELIPSGAIAGIVVFPPNYGQRDDQENPVLLRYWLHRSVRIADGLGKAATGKLVRARPDAAAALGVEEAEAQASDRRVQALQLIQKEETP